MADRTVGVGILGGGTVGSALIDIITSKGAFITQRTGIQLVVRQVAVKNVTRNRSFDNSLVTDNAASVVANPEVDVVVELMGGVDEAGELVSQALGLGKPVVTANKALIAARGPELAELSAKAGTQLLFEASVAGGVPLMRPLRESLAGEQIDQVVGIINGTTNYVLTRMTEAGVTYSQALAEAQKLGYAEADPTADVEGFDAAAKAAVIANVAFGSVITTDDVYREGISGVTADDVDLARRLGYVVKPVVVVQRSEDAGVGANATVAVAVHPAMVAKDHPLASVRLAFNAVFVEGPHCGQLMFYGQGAGGGPTASAVLGDLIDVSRNLGSVQPSVTTSSTTQLRPIGEQVNAFYLVIDVRDRPGVLARVANVFGQHNVSIRSMEQVGLTKEARLVFVTHPAREADMKETVEALRLLDEVSAIGNVMRVMDTQA